MAAFENKTARQIDLRARPPGGGGIVRVTLNPGFNVVDDEKATIVMRNPLCRQLEEHGVIVTNVKMSKDEELIQQDLKRDMQQQQQQVHELARPTRSASLISGDRAGVVGPAVAEGAGPDGRTVIEDTDELGL